MKLIIGGYCSGKRRFARQLYPNGYWLSAYEGKYLKDWPTESSAPSPLIIEGWERWIEADLMGNYDVKQLRTEYANQLDTYLAHEQASQQPICLILLEIGRGIVPIEAKQRALRDLNGWLSQDAAERCDEVFYAWNGLVRPIKTIG
ncbi:bifunctional adenosylcobinamide kinase/adenosylcobinamide-phosphate guanylyltransferase [Nitrincola alkalisediminis]|uniref:bifunctional adenosylcobinamide kinase/adenosylcobinamide-phosphate guanylyltransferase n=1 Tax=Nitrincola alkalisediminis TaxID=1366656 RepID=UPI001FE50DE8|nr:bifunctional adenosylcobinamide kinase/adenosylcobinamide-phosphate guanylyltransferase [Nitrincola alkalisediminis]